MTALALGITLAIGGSLALVIGNSSHAAIERHLQKRRQARASREAGARIAARMAAGDKDA